MGHDTSKSLLDFSIDEILLKKVITPNFLVVITRAERKGQTRNKIEEHVIQKNKKS